MSPTTQPLPLGRPSFLGAPRCDDPDALRADVAILGIPYTTPHDLDASRGPCSAAPAALREQSLRLGERLHHYDFDFGGPLLAGRAVRFADLGDVHALPGRYTENSQIATAAVRAVLARGALPIVLGGDHAATLPALRAYSSHGPLCVVHLGADLDWCDTVNGVPDARHSAMRRAAELGWVEGMLQVGLRGTGSARQQDVETARGWGAALVGAAEVHERGVEAALARLPRASAYYVTLDLAALDPAIAPGVDSPAFGGLTYFQVTSLLKAVVARGAVVGFDLVGIVPDHDRHDVTSLLGVRLALNLVGALAHAGRIGRAEATAPAARQQSPALALAGS